MNREWLYIEIVEECGTHVEGLVISHIKKDATRFTLKAAFAVAEKVRNQNAEVIMQVEHARTKETIPVSAL